MASSIKCASCGTVFKNPDPYTTSKVQCPKCSEVFVVEAEEEEIVKKSYEEEETVKKPYEEEEDTGWKK